MYNIYNKVGTVHRNYSVSKKTLFFSGSGTIVKDTNHRKRKGLKMYTNVHESAAINIYHELKEQILHLELPPGTNVSEIDTAAKYDSSRTPVRDAFKMLEGEGLLEIYPHVGTFVTYIDLEMLSDILYTRNVLEQAILRDLSLSRPSFQDFHIELLLKHQQSLLESDLTTEDQSRAFIISDNEFHNFLYSLAGKQNVMEFFVTPNNQYERFRTFVNLYMPENMRTLYEEHRMIWEYISHQEPDKLADCLTHHIYDGFNASSQVVFEHPEYFKKPQ